MTEPAANDGDAVPGADHGDAVPAVIRRTRIVPVVVLDDARAAVPLGRALIAGGLPVAEVTLRTAAAPDAIRALAAQPGMCVGAGTVLTASQVDTAVDAGASFVVSPGLSPAVVERCGERGVPVIPGVATATEVQSAFAAGLRTVKFFPAQTSGGPAAIRALAGPFGMMRFVPTGGIGPATLADYLAVPAVLEVGGSWMVAPELVAAGRFDEVERMAADTVALVTGDGAGRGDRSAG